MYQFRVLYKIQDDGSYLASVPSLPGCIASGENFDEAQEMIQDAIQ
jgi:predicted RNase H-like HicB family nuclease